jgi:hypothetical protein
MSNSVNQDRLRYLQEYFDSNLIKVEVTVFKTETSKGTVHSYFNGSRYGYQFNNRGIAWVKREDLHKFKNQQQFIIHDEKEGN